MSSGVTVRDGVLTRVSPEEYPDGVFVIPEGVHEIGEDAFANWVWDYNEYGNQWKEVLENTLLKEVHIPDSVQMIGYGAFHNCVNLKEVRLPKDLQEIETYAFGFCRSLQTVTFTGNQCRIIRGEAFCSCDSLKNVTLPDGLTIIDDGAFGYCRELRTVVLPRSVRYIYGLAFLGCERLMWVDMSSVKEALAEENAFEACEKLILRIALRWNMLRGRLVIRERFRYED